MDTREFHNLERHSDYDFSFQAANRLPGVSAMLRVRNEASKIRCCLMSVLGIFDEIIVVDNNSDDGTREIVNGFKQEHDRTGKLRLFEYPFRVARCGTEHDDTPEDSVHNLAYYYNWTVSQCTRRYICKWDADMVVRREERDVFKAFLDRLDGQEPRAVLLTGQSVYRDPSGQCFLAAEDVMTEPRLFPFGSDNYYFKARHFERVRFAPSLPVEPYGGGIVFYELKFVDEDEFSHWSTRQFPTGRKQQEWESVELLRRGGSADGRFVPLPPGFLDDQCGG